MEHVKGVDATLVGSDDAPLERETVGALDVGEDVELPQIVALMEHLDAGLDEITARSPRKPVWAADLDALAERLRRATWE